MSKTAIAVRTCLVTALVLVIGMAFRVSWGALRDVAIAVGIDEAAADLYAFVVDGLIAVAVVALFVLTGAGRRFALWVLGAYTASSLALNYVHGLVPALHGIQPGEHVALSPVPQVHWGLVLLASALPVGSIFFGSDLVARVLRAPSGDVQPVPVSPSVPVSVSRPASKALALPAAALPAQLICGEVLPVPSVPERPRLDTADARRAIEEAWAEGLSVRDAARRATRSPAQVQRVYRQLDDERGAVPVPGQMEFAGATS